MRVGLTGGIGAGKSSVASLLRELGAYVIDADAVARDVVEPGQPALAEIATAFGAEVLGPDGRLDRGALASVVFSDPARLRELEAITHPRIAARVAELAEVAPPGVLVVYDHPLLVETGQAGDFDALIVVDVPVETQVRRLVEQRGMTEVDARARIGAQASRAQRLALATYVIDNTGTQEDLRRRATEVFSLLVSTLSQERD
ncbi:MAG: dephospho-CoA kinase [Nocardioides sp.]